MSFEPATGKHHSGASQEAAPPQPSASSVSTRARDYLPELLPMPASSYTVSHHHTQCHIIIHSVTSSYTVSHHHTQCHIIIHSVTSSYTVSQHQAWSRCTGYLRFRVYGQHPNTRFPYTRTQVSIHTHKRTDESSFFSHTSK
jgi:hypothetical protein